MLVPAFYNCAFCGETIEVEIDPSAGSRQTYVEDCQVCCRPNLLTVRLDANGDGATIDADREND